MKKRSARRLTLNRETLVDLQNRSLGKVVGGASVRPGACCFLSDSCPPPPTGHGEYETCLC